MTLHIVDFGLQRPLSIEETEITQPFWQGLTQGKFLVQRCDNCARLNFPPRKICPGCLSRVHSWVEMSGRGTLYSASKIHASPSIYGILSPMRVAIIDLEEGIRLVTRLLPEGRTLELDSPVELLITCHPDGYHYAARSV